MWDFIFYQSGSVEAKVHATGYIASSFTLKDNFLFGHQVAENVTGNIHTHFINFKVDLDVLGVYSRTLSMSEYNFEKCNN